jgi:hypothetical protein
MKASRLKVVIPESVLLFHMALSLKLWSVKADSVISRWKRDGVLGMPFA